VPKDGSFTYTRRGCRFNWKGGAYIDISIDGQAVEVINVYDYDKGEVEIATREQFVAECEEWLEATSPDDLRPYIEFARQQKAYNQKLSRPPEI
jgi:hypothetical protein